MEIKMSEKSETNAWPNIFGFGLLMGAADAVPGVSGGTIALIIGIPKRYSQTKIILATFLEVEFFEPFIATPAFPTEEAKA